MRKRALRTAIYLTLALSLSVLVCCEHTAPSPPNPTLSKPPATPKRLLVMVFDQMRPDYIERFDLKNFKALSATSLAFKNAYVGDLFSVTITSHPVITTGVFPKRLPWQDELFPDVKGLLGPRNRFYNSMELNASQYATLLQSTKPTSLSARLKALNAGGVFSVAQKPYAAYSFGGPFTDTTITLSPIRKQNPLKGWREPTGINVPDFIKNPFGGRFYLDCSLAFGSQNTLYPLDGTRYVPGNDPTHVGGDAWVGDVVLNIFQRQPKWKAIFASFGAIDKISHMLAEHDEPTKEKWAIDQKMDLKSTLERADEVLGRILTALSTKGLDSETLVVVTSDHGGQANTAFYGSTAAGSGESNSVYVKAENYKSLAIPAALKNVFSTQLVEASVHSTALRFWLKRKDRVSFAKFADLLRLAPGVAEVYTRQDTGQSIQYIRTYRSSELTGPALDWAQTHHQEFLGSIAATTSPDVVALLLDRHGYGLLGDHGGAQEAVQRVPLLVRSPNTKPQIADAPVQLVDINPIVTRLMGLPIPEGLDGSAGVLDTLPTD